jgi:hypothetical protein
MLRELSKSHRCSILQILGKVFSLSHVEVGSFRQPYLLGNLYITHNISSIEQQVRMIKTFAKLTKGAAMTMKVSSNSFIGNRVKILKSSGKPAGVNFLDMQSCMKVQNNIMDSLAVLAPSVLKSSPRSPAI